MNTPDSLADARDFQRPSVVPPGAVVRVTERTPHCAIGEVHLGDRRVGRDVWDLDGPLSQEQYYDLDDRRHGVEREYLPWSPTDDDDFDRPIVWVNEWRHGMMHGWSILLDDDGPITVTPLVDDTGIDFFGSRGSIGEMRELVGGHLHGLVRWGDSTGLTSEEHFVRSRLHGISRRWDAVTGALEPDHPQFHIDGEQVTRDTYLAACADDPTLPPYRPEDDQPTRPEHPALTDALARAAEWAPTFDLDAWLAERDAALLALWADAG